MKTLMIEWKHLDMDGATCVRCRDTGKTLAEMVGELKRECRQAGVRVVFRETLLGTNRIRLFTSLPIAQPDGLSLKQKMEEIGKKSL